jgi:hypothetical protein
MRPVVRVALAIVLIVTLLGAGAACAIGGTSSGSPQPSAFTPFPSGSPTPKLDPAVAMPPTFPSDVPIYPGARLTSQANFTSSGQSTWGMEWETFDSVDKVTAFYTARLNQGDWSLTFSGGSNGAFTAIFTRKSNATVDGILGVDGSSGVTKISLALS